MDEMVPVRQEAMRMAVQILGPRALALKLPEVEALANGLLRYFLTGTSAESREPRKKPTKIAEMSDDEVLEYLREQGPSTEAGPA